jgi:3',5'-cyclic AMP phosphodiesterase CpdA
MQLSDTHISHLDGKPSENMSLLVEYVNNELRPDLVIHTGDVVILNPDSLGDRLTAWRLHQKIDAPLLVLPGNHDVGESGDDPWMGYREGPR